MHTNFSTERLRRELQQAPLIEAAARRYADAGDPTAMRAIYLLRRQSELTVSEVADLVGVSVSAMSRCLRRLEQGEIVTSRKDGQAVRYRLAYNEFTRTLVGQLGG